MKTPKRAEARQKWARVAAGDFDDPALREWLAVVARRLLAADDLSDPDGNARPSAVMLAVDLRGSKRNTSREREVMRALVRIATNPATAAMLGLPPAPTPEQQRDAVRRVVVASRGLPSDYIDSASGRKKIDALIRVAMREGK